MTRAALLAGALALSPAAGALSDPPIGGNTPCAAVVFYLDARDSVHAREAFLAVKQLIADYDAQAVARGEPSALAPLRPERAETFYIAGIEYCRDEPRRTLGQVSLDAYEGLRELHGEAPGRR